MIKNCVMISILTISLLSSCKTNLEKSENFNEVDHYVTTQKVEASDIEWLNFKLIANNSIAINEYHIEVLKNKLEHSDMPYDDSYLKKILDFEIKNDSLKDRIILLDSNTTHWKRFRNHISSEIKASEEMYKSLSVNT